MKKQQVLLVAFLLTPLLVLIMLVRSISAFMERRSESVLPKVGAGANTTGGANAIGEMLSGNRANAGAVRPTEARAHRPRNLGLEVSTSGSPTEVSAEPVAPESLDQGFILLVRDKSGRANQTSPIYLAGTVNNWNPGDPAFRLEAQSDQKWRIALKKPAHAPMEFKFTRGSWKLEELNAAMQPPANRTLPKIDVSGLAPGEQPRIELVVEHWGDERPDFDPGDSASFRGIKVAGGSLKRLEVHGGAAGASGKSRELLVWLPPGYDDPANADRRYPVLYMHDAQNLFEKHAGAPDEWKVDETASRLIASGDVRPFIVVGLPHSGPTRISEYLPIDAFPGVEPRGGDHVRWIIEEVMPRVESAFRVRPGPAATGIGGSSMGAVISLFAAGEHPDKFGFVLAESLPLSTGNSAAWDSWVDGVKTWPGLIYLGVGGNETGAEPDKAARNRAYVEAVRSLDAKLSAAGLGPDRKLLRIEDSAVHNEGAWAARLPEALRFLFRTDADATK